jgi:D-lactate dehydrogenase
MFSSKGYKDAFKYMADKTIDALWEATEEGNFAVVVDVTSCTLTLLHCREILSKAQQQKFDKIRIIDSIEYIDEYIIPAIKITIKKKAIVLHPVCSVYKMNMEDRFEKIATHFADVVHIPDYAGCCGMAGDRGFLFPELTQAATKMEATEAPDCNGYYSSSKPCEIAMSEATGKNYESILYLVDEATKR